MAVPLQGNVSHDEIARDGTAMCMPQRKWYFSREEIKHQTPSRADGIDYKRETHLQKLYCSFLQELGIELKVPQVTIATAMMLCHRFYMRQSHAKNDWQTISTACMFLACKAEETPRWLGELVVVAYKLIYKSDPSAPRRIREIYDKQKELVVVAERLILATVAFDLNIEHPYKPLVAVLKKLDISHKELVKVAWNFVNDCLRTSLCLQHKPHYIAAGSIFLAAKFQKVKLPSEKGKAWWMEFDVSPKQLEEVIQQMMDLWQQNRKLVVPPKDQCVTEQKPIISKAMSSSPQSCILSGSSTAYDSKTAASPDSGRLAKSMSSACTDTQSSGKCLEDSKSVPSADAGRLATSTSTCIQTQAYHNVHEHLKDIKAVAPSHADKSENFIASTVIQTQAYCNVHESSKDSEVVGSPDTERLAKSTTSTCTQTQAIVKVHDSSQEAVNCQISDCGSANSIVDDGDGGEPVTGKSGPISSYKIGSLEVGNSQVDVNRIREKLKKRKFNRSSNKKSAETMEVEIDGEAWIERELENGIELESSFPEKRKRI